MDNTVRVYYLPKIKRLCVVIIECTTREGQVIGKTAFEIDSEL